MEEHKVIWSNADVAYIATCKKYPLLSGIGASAYGALKEMKIAIELAEEIEREDVKNKGISKLSAKALENVNKKYSKSLKRLAKEIEREDNEWQKCGFTRK